MALAACFAMVVVTTVISSPDAPARAGQLPDTPLDCVNWRYGASDEPGVLPPEFDRDDYKRTSLRDPRPELHDSPQNHCGQKGAAVDLAWGLSRGRPDVVIAVLDSGIRWRNAGVMSDLATKAGRTATRSRVLQASPVLMQHGLPTGTDREIAGWL